METVSWRFYRDRIKKILNHNTFHIHWYKCQVSKLQKNRVETQIFNLDAISSFSVCWLVEASGLFLHTKGLTQQSQEHQVRHGVSGRLLRMRIASPIIKKSTSSFLICNPLISFSCFMAIIALAETLGTIMDRRVERIDTFVLFLFLI